MATPGITDDLETLLAGVARKDGQALARLYEITRAKLFSVALRILRKDEAAEEVLQESFVAIWAHAGDYSAALSAPMTWMTTIVRNRCLDIVRRPQAEVAELHEGFLENVEDEAAGPLQRLAESRDAKALADCMKRLAGAERQSIMLAFFHGLTHSELAQHLREPLGTVKTRIRRGLHSLKDCLSRRRK